MQLASTRILNWLLLLPFAYALRALSTSARTDVNSSPVTKPRFKVAVAIVAPYGLRKSKGWRDAFAVLAQSVKEIAPKSSHDFEVVALVPNTIPNKAAEREEFQRLGIRLMPVPIPVPLATVKNPDAREVLKGALGEFEQLKFYGAALTEYDRVVIVDGDVIFVQPFDELLESVTSAYALAGVYDHEMDTSFSVFPPVNSGFLVFSPNQEDFDRIVNIYKRGDIGGAGWDKSGTGWTYGTGSQGLLSYYYNQARPHGDGIFSGRRPSKGVDYPGFNWTHQPTGCRFLPQDRSAYNVIDTDMMQACLKAGHTTAARVKVFHFAGGACPKPWTCQVKKGDTLCDIMTARWWKLRKAVEDAHQLSTAKQCQGGYNALNLAGS